MKGPNARESSPKVGLSTFITSAPKSARIIVAKGPAKTRVKSRTRIPVKGPLIYLPSILLIAYTLMKNLFKRNLIFILQFFLKKEVLGEVLKV
jgi:hypothetical protein